MFTVVLALALSAGAWWYARTSIPPAPHEPVTVLIADFENNTNDATFDHTLEPMIRLALEGASFINAYDRSRIRRMFGVQPPEKLDERAAREVAMKQGIGFVLSGSIDRTGDGYAISVKAAQPITGNVSASVKNRASNKDEVPGVVTKMASTIRNALGDKASQTDQLFAMRTISTTSLDVISQYAAGIELQSKGKYEEARGKFLKAVALDPQFGLGYQSLSVTSRNVGKLQDAEMYAKEALRYLDGMTERERFSTRGNYYWNTGDLQQCVKEYGDLIARYAADTVAHNQRAICLGRLRDYRGAMSETRKALQVLPNHVTYRANLALFRGLRRRIRHSGAGSPSHSGSDCACLAGAAAPSDRTGPVSRCRRDVPEAAEQSVPREHLLRPLVLATWPCMTVVSQMRCRSSSKARWKTCARRMPTPQLKINTVAFGSLLTGRSVEAVAAADRALSAATRCRSDSSPLEFWSRQAQCPRAQALAAGSRIRTRDGAASVRERSSKPTSP